MPVFNTRGVAAGGRVKPWINGVVPPLLARTHGGGPCWATDDTLLFNARVTESPEVYATNLYAIIGQVVGPVGPGANDRVGGGGVWATKDSRGYRDSLGRTDETGKWHPLAVCEQTGDVAICTDVTQNPAAGLIVLSRSGGFTLVHAGPLDSLEACFDGGVLVYEADGVLKSWSRAGAAPPVPKFGVRGVRHSGGWRVGFSDTHEATVVHRLGGPQGIVVSRGHADFYPDIHVANGVITVATSAGQAEHAHEYKRFVVDDAMPRVDLRQVPYAPVVPIGRKLWFGFFEFGAAPTGLPSNARIPVVQGAPWLAVNGPGWRYVAGNPDGDWEAIVRAIDHVTDSDDDFDDVVAYAPRGVFDRVGYFDAIVGLECYLGVNESDDQFISRIGATLARCNRAVLIAQCYTSNTNNTQDLRRIPGLISALAHDHANVEGIFVFSAGSRATGWSDHPEVHDAWHQVFRGITGVPDSRIPNVPVEEPPVEPTPIPAPPVEPPVLPEPEPLPEVGNTPEPEPSPEVTPVKKKINGVKIVKDIFRALAKWDVAKLLGLKKKRQAPGPHVPPAEPPPFVPSPESDADILADIVAFPGRAEVLNYRGHLCNLKDSAGRVIWTPSLPGAAPEIRKEWLETIAAHGGTHVPIGPFTGGPSYPGVHWPNPDWTNNAFAIRALVFDILNTKTLAGHGMVPVLFLDNGGRHPKPRIQEFYEVAHEALKDLYAHVLIVPCGWEPVVGDWTSAEVSYALKLWHAIAPESIIAYHGSPARLVGSSNPVEPDDPWQGGESEFYKTHGGEHIDIALYQTPHGRELYEECDPNNESCWLDRWRDYVTRIGGGLNGWRVIPIVLFESVAYEYFRGQKNEDDARTIASRAKAVADAAGVTVGYGNGLPWEIHS